MIAERLFSGRRPNERRSLLPGPAGILAALIIVLGLYVTALRFTKGPGGMINPDDYYPWGFLISFNLLCGVVLSACGYVATSAYYLFRLKEFKAATRPALTTAFLGYFSVVVALHYDVGQPWRLVYPIFWSPGVTSVLFEVGLCVFVYLSVLAVEWLVYVCEWRRWTKLRSVIVKLTIPLTIFGVVLSTMHQSSLGALYLIVPSKMHPLWYSEFLPVFFFISSMYAGMSMIILEGSLTSKTLNTYADDIYQRDMNKVILSCARSASIVMMGYLCIIYYNVAMNDGWSYLRTGYGMLFLAETVGFVAIPSFLYAVGVRKNNILLLKVTSVVAVAGIILNRFDVSLVAFNFNIEERYFPSWMEIIISLFIITLLIMSYRLICKFMPVLRRHPDYNGSH